MELFSTLDVWDRVTVHESLVDVVKFVRHTSADALRTKYYLDREATVELSVETLTELFANSERESTPIYLRGVSYRPSFKIQRLNLVRSQ